MKTTRSIVIGSAGHIDHGKTALVLALTGIDTDRLPEEKRRGITIDLGFASLEMSGSDGLPMRVSFVDVPGHALFIRNMLAGAGCVSAVMLVIAGDEGVMPQTREHLAICGLLGMSDGFTVISKSDLVNDAQLEEVRREIATFLQGTFLGGAQNAIIPVSAKTGVGMAEVRVELAKLAMRARAVESIRPIRLPIDRTFVKKGFGTVVTGTLLSGELRVGQSLLIEPGAKKARVRGLQTHGESEERAAAGTRVAVNLAGVETGEISRGQTLVVPDELSAVDMIDAEVTLLEGTSPLKHRARVHMHAFTSETMAMVALYGNEAVKPGTARLARLKLASPIVLAPGDRFVLRQPLPAGTIGGGRVLDTALVAHEKRAVTRGWLEALAHASPGESLILRVRRRGTSGIRIGVMAREMGFTVAAVRDLVNEALEGGGLVLLHGDLLLAPEAIRQVMQLVLTRAKDAGATGLKRSELESQSAVASEILDAAVEKLATKGILRLQGETIRGAGDANGPGEKDTRERDTRKLLAVAAAYKEAGLAPLAVGEFAQRLRIAAAEMRQLVTLLLRERALIRMGDDDTFIHTDSLKDLVARLASKQGKTLDVAAFKTLTGLTRKHAIPLLELLDRERITRKEGDVRVIL